MLPECSFHLQYCFLAPSAVDVAITALRPGVWERLPQAGGARLTDRVQQMYQTECGASNFPLNFGSCAPQLVFHLKGILFVRWTRLIKALK
eukprot:6358595-Heterocapsa_arctica.AAC.1